MRQVGNQYIIQFMMHGQKNIKLEILCRKTIVLWKLWPTEYTHGIPVCWVKQCEISLLSSDRADIHTNIAVFMLPGYAPCPYDKSGVKIKKSVDHCGEILIG